MAEVGKAPLDPSAPFYEQEVCLLGKAHHSVEAKVVPIFSVIYVFTHTNLCPVPHSTALAMNRFSVKETPGEGSQPLSSRSKQVNDSLKTGTQETGAESHWGGWDGWCGVLPSSARHRPSLWARSPAPEGRTCLWVPRAWEPLLPSSAGHLSLANAGPIRGSWSPAEGPVGYGRVTNGKALGTDD